MLSESTRRAGLAKQVLGDARGSSELDDRRRLSLEGTVWVKKHWRVGVASPSVSEVADAASDSSHCARDGTLSMTSFFSEVL